MRMVWLQAFTHKKLSLEWVDEHGFCTDFYLSSCLCSCPFISFQSLNKEKKKKKKWVELYDGKCSPVTSPERPSIYFVAKIKQEQTNTSIPILLCNFFRSIGQSLSRKPHPMPFCPFPDDKNLTLSKLEAFADDKINVT